MALGTMVAGSACTSNSIFGLFNMPCANDASAIILQEIFGRQIASMVTGMTMPPTAQLIPQFIYNFNSVLLTGALLLYAIIITVGTVNTSHHGKFLGQQWDSIWTILRIIFGTVFMVPLKYGFNIAQIIVLGCILFGAHAASVVWYSSLHNVYTGTTPTVPASAMDIVKQAIANELVMATYNAETHNKHPTRIPLANQTTGNLFSPEATGLRSNIQQLTPSFCKVALGLVSAYPSQGNLVSVDPDQSITGMALAKYNACQQFVSDFLASQNYPYYASSQYASIFDKSGETGPAQMWIGNTIYAPTIWYLNASLYSFFPGKGPDGSNHIYAAQIANPGIQGTVLKIYGQQTGGSFNTTPPSRAAATGYIKISTVAQYIPPPTKPTASQIALLNAINTFIQNNILAQKCLSPTPDKSCSNNIDEIIKDFNQNMPGIAPLPAKGMEISSSTMTPTASEHDPIPGTHTPLNSSWWNAGEIYLIVDKQMAANLSELYKQLSNLSGPSPVGQYQANTNATTRLSMSLGTNGKTVTSTASAFFSAAYQSTAATGLWKDFLAGTGWDKNGFLYKTFSEVPASDSLSFLLLANALDIKANPGGAYVISRLIQVMQANGMLGSDNSSTLTPIVGAMNKIFDGLLGSTDGASVSGNLTGLMDEVYSLGVSNNAYGMIGKNLSVIQNAQRTGMDMIVTVMNSITTVYNHFETQYNDLRSKVSAIGLGTTTAAASLATIAAASGFIPVEGAGIAAGTGAVAEVTAQAGQMAIQITSLLKMSSILQSLMWLPIVIVVLTALFTAGVAFALMLPLIPFILFWAGQIAWILGSLEAVIAAPFLMLALILPGGHHFAGHSVPGLRMLLGVIFRPLLMVLGLLIGLVLTYIVISFSADAFHVVAVTLIGGKMNGVMQAGIIPNTANYKDANGIIACLLLFVYCSFLMLAFQKCFSPIYLLPEKVIQMMGGQADKAGEQDLQGLQQGVTQQSQSLAQSGGQAANKGIEAQQQKTQATQRSWESGAGASSKPYSQSKQGLYDKEAWQRHKDGKKNQSAGLSAQGGGSAGSNTSGGSSSRPENNPALQGRSNSSSSSST